MTGLHGRAERGPRGVTLYLLPGLTSGQRSAVIRRLRQEASRGFGPRLPLPQLAVALGLDRVRAAARTAGAIVRLHPVVTLLPGAFMVAAMALFIIASSDGPDATPSMRTGLAQATVPQGGKNLPTVSAGSAPTRTAAPAADAGASVGAGGKGLSTGQSAQVPHCTVAARAGARYNCPQGVVSQISRSCDGKAVCRHAGS